MLGSSSVALADDEATLKKHCDDMLVMHDTDKDGQLSKDEYTKAQMDMFAKYDKNNDGMLGKEEHRAMGMDMHKMMMGKMAMPDGKMTKDSM